MSDLDGVMRRAAAQVAENVTGVDSFTQELISDLLAALRDLREERERLEKQIYDAKLWGFDDGFDWAGRLIDLLGDRHDEELCDGPEDLIAELAAALAPPESEGEGT